MRRPAIAVSAASVAVLLSVAGALAQPAGKSPSLQIEALEREVTDLVDRALAEWRVFLTCSATEPATHALVSDIWQEEVEKGAAMMRELGFSSAFVDDFAARADLSGFMMGSPFADVVAYCAEHADWPRRLAIFDFILLERELETIALP